ncbi:MAG: hypothetical protein AYK19_10595 [Theionarchaea archaeon DG-70-1]|nr:MAG: hypothetical protein AYK19_10595 [Theionarchaea archaeon DG-70-1]
MVQNIETFEDYTVLTESLIEECAACGFLFLVENTKNEWEQRSLLKMRDKVIRSERICQICQRREYTRVCPSCKRRICDSCSKGWLLKKCVHCAQK